MKPYFRDVFFLVLMSIIAIACGSTDEMDLGNDELSTQEKKLYQYVNDISNRLLEVDNEVKTLLKNSDKLPTYDYYNDIDTDSYWSFEFDNDRSDMNSIEYDLSGKVYLEKTLMESWFNYDNCLMFGFDDELMCPLTQEEFYDSITSDDVDRSVNYDLLAIRVDKNFPNVNSTYNHYIVPNFEEIYDERFNLGCVIREDVEKRTGDVTAEILNSSGDFYIFRYNLYPHANPEFKTSVMVGEYINANIKGRIVILYDTYIYNYKVLDSVLWHIKTDLTNQNPTEETIKITFNDLSYTLEITNDFDNCGDDIRCIAVNNLRYAIDVMFDVKEGN